jgi:hypothetical protein
LLTRLISISLTDSDFPTLEELFERHSNTTNSYLPAPKSLTKGSKSPNNTLLLLQAPVPAKRQKGNARRPRQEVVKPASPERVYRTTRLKRVTKPRNYKE